MFTAAHPSAFGRAHGFANAYARVGVETSVNSASAHKLIELLFNGFMDAIVLARGAMRAKQIEAKGKAIGRAARIIEEGLKAGLNMEAGGRLAEDLAALYAYVALRLTAANLRNDEAALDECVRLIDPLREAWIAIGPQVEAGGL
ncbi:MAG: flagellar export chaperone FliS [Betaproteobacteria bacterium]